MKKFWLALLFIMSCLCLWQCEMIVYGIGQGIGQLKIVNNAKPIEEVLADPQFPDSLKSKLLLVQEIREFAIDSLGINNSENYTTVYDQKGEPVLWVVTACSTFSTEPYQWHYPFLGEMGYMGFFDKEKAIKKEKEMQEMGLDVDMDNVTAWSTLGWFKDPILSEMLTKTEGELARLIIHELTHATLFVEDDTEFNENLATFVGDIGGYEFMKYKYGEGSKEYQDYDGKLKDIQLFSSYIISCSQQLQKLYDGFSSEMSHEEKLEQKNNLIKEIMYKANNLSYYDKENFSHILKADKLPNNTFFATFNMYRAGQKRLEKEFHEQFNGNFRNFMDHLKEQYGKAELNGW